MFFVPPRGRKSMKNRSKIASQCILNEESKTTPKNAPKSLQHGSKIGPSWGHVGLRSRLGAVQERRENDTERDTEKEAQKDTKKDQKKIRRPSHPAVWRCPLLLDLLSFNKRYRFPYTTSSTERRFPSSASPLLAPFWPRKGPGGASIPAAPPLPTSPPGSLRSRRRD